MSATLSTTPDYPPPEDPTVAFSAFFAFETYPLSFLSPEQFSMLPMPESPLPTLAFRLSRLIDKQPRLLLLHTLPPREPIGKEKMRTPPCRLPILAHDLTTLCPYFPFLAKHTKLA